MPDGLLYMMPLDGSNDIGAFHAVILLGHPLARVSSMPISTLSGLSIGSTFSGFSCPLWKTVQAGPVPSLPSPFLFFFPLFQTETTQRPFLDKKDLFFFISYRTIRSWIGLRITPALLGMAFLR